MALLDEATNKSYRNAPYFIKRRIISNIAKGKDKSKASRFIPFCTRNVFDKYYTCLPHSMMHWNRNDYLDYLQAIVDAIYEYTP